MNGRLFGDSLICKAAVIDGCVYLILGKHFIYSLCPIFSPETDLFFAVPPLGNGILPAVSGAFRMLVHTLISFFQCCRWSQIYFLLACLIAVLLLPSFLLCFFKFCGSKAFFLTIFYTKIFFFCFILPCPVFVQWTDGKKNVCMRVMTVGIVDGKISTHSQIYKVLLNKIPNERDIAVGIQFYGKSHNKFSRQSAIFCFFSSFHSIPELLPILPIRWSHWWKHYFLIYQPMFSCIVMLDAIIIIVHPAAAHIGGSGNGRPPGAPADNLGFHVVNCHRHEPPLCDGV